MAAKILPLVGLLTAFPGKTGALPTPWIVARMLENSTCKVWKTHNLVQWNDVQFRGNKQELWKQRPLHKVGVRPECPEYH